MKKIKRGYFITLGVIAFIFDLIVGLFILFVVAGTQ
jgi:hypothetical protein